MKKEIFKKEQVWRLNQDNYFLLLTAYNIYRVCILIFQNIITNTPNYHVSEKRARFLDKKSSFGG